MENLFVVVWGEQCCEYSCEWPRQRVRDSAPDFEMNLAVSALCWQGGHDQNMKLVDWVGQVLGPLGHKSIANADAQCGQNWFEHG